MADDRSRTLRDAASAKELGRRLSAEARPRLELTRTIHQSGLFEVAEGHVNHIPVCVKRWRPDEVFGRRLAMFRFAHYLQDVENYHNRNYFLFRDYAHTRERLPDLFPPPRDEAQARRALRHVKERLLIEEAVTVDYRVSAWNHHLAGVGYLHAGGELSWSDDAPGRPGEVCLLMPRWPGRALAEYPSSDQRRLYPMLLLSLWDALYEHPHGNLSTSSILLDPSEAFFRLLGPGASLTLHYEDETVERDAVVFTTTPENYPLVSPHLRWSIGRSWADLRVFLGCQMVIEETSYRFNQELREILSTPRGERPYTFDIIAMGCLYLKILTGQTLLEVQPYSALKLPLWYHAPSSWCEIVIPYEHTDSTLAAFYYWLERRIEHTLQARFAASPEEAALCGQLIRGEIADRETLAQRLLAVLIRLRDGGPEGT